MGEIYLVRHGQASFGTKNYDQLSEVGLLQAHHLGTYFSARDITFDHIFTGTQRRHQQTADGILHSLSPAPCIPLSGLNEYDFSALYDAYMAQHPEEEQVPSHGPRTVFYRRLKRALALWSTGRLAGELPETWDQFTTRVSAALTEIQSIVSGRGLVVSSGGAIAAALGHVLNLESDRVININLQIKNASFSHFYTSPDSLQLASFNNIPHLDRTDRLDAITYS